MEGGELSMTIPAESLQGGCEVVWPTKVQDLVVELGNVIATF